MKKRGIDKESDRTLGGSEKHYRGWEGKEFIIGFEGPQALPVCPSERLD
jgi:hypothetical protein